MIHFTDVCPSLGTEVVARIIKPKPSLEILSEKHGLMHPHLGVRKTASPGFLLHDFQMLFGDSPCFEDFTS